MKEGSLRSGYYLAVILATLAMATLGLPVAALAQTAQL